MAVVNTKSRRVSLPEATPIKPQPAILSGADLRSIVGTVEIAAADDDTSVYRICRVHSSWCIQSIRAFCDAITGGTDYDVGLYQTAENGGAVVLVNAYADTITLATALNGLEVAYENRNIDKIENRVWQDAGLSADPNRFYDLCFTGATVGTGAGTLSAQVVFTAEA